MYSGTTLHHKSGNVLGVHQKINKVAHRLAIDYGQDFFPPLKSVQHFEGKNGPDGIKRKNPGADEPWHFIDPKNPREDTLLQQIKHHEQSLRGALKNKDEQKASFEAAWLSHAIVDGLTPAHHFPFEEHLEGLRGEPKETRDSMRKKLVISGETKRATLRNNWEFWGAKGVMTSHLLFELGVASAITPLRAGKLELTSDEIGRVKELGIQKVFLENLQTIAELQMYETFTQKGWTPTLARQTKKKLIPLIIKTVALSWIYASDRR
ncbi:MAG: hypothetical protein Q7T74_04770 [Candidatus Saccharibacteria bacterium]|nr:hypothetical protein [Candidatus Saccharibacteria bacterium]